MSSLQSPAQLGSEAGTIDGKLYIGADTLRALCGAKWLIQIDDPAARNSAL
jgi:hypothetical protein